MPHNLEDAQLIELKLKPEEFARKVEKLPDGPKRLVAIFVQADLRNVGTNESLRELGVFQHTILDIELKNRESRE